jgi:hypothetical protein
VTDLDELLADLPIAGPSLTGATCKPATCRRHRWVASWANGAQGVYVCERCGRTQDVARSRRGKSARSRGNAYERELAKKLGGKRTGMFGGPDDVTTSLFTCQVKVRKAFPSWMTDEIDKLTRTATTTPILVVANSPGPGYKRRAIVVVDLADWVDLHGEIAGAAG